MPAAESAPTAAVVEPEKALSFTMPPQAPQDGDAGGKVVKNATKKDGMASIAQMLRYATGFDFFLFIAGCFFGACNGTAMTGFSIVLGSIFDKLNSPHPGDATAITLYFVWIGLGAMAASTLQVGLLTAASERMTVRLRHAYLESILKQDIAYFDRAGTGQLASAVAENALLYREALGEKLGGIFQFYSMFIAGIVVGFTYLWQLTLVILAVTPLLALSGWIMASAMTKLVSGQLESYARAGAIAEETFSLIRTVTGLHVQQHRVDLYDAELALATAKSTRGGLTQGIGFGFTFFCFFSTYGLAYYVGAVLIANSHKSLANAYPPPAVPAQLYCVLNGTAPPGCTASASDVGSVTFETVADICACYACECGCYHNGPSSASECVTGGTVVLCFFAVLIGAFGLGQAAPNVAALMRGRIASKRIFDVIDREPEIRDDPSGKKLDAMRGEFVLNNVAFTYPSRPDMPIFKNLSMVIPAGKRCALVGQSGSGKSTIIALLQRYYRPLGGSITLDGVPLEQLSLSWLRQQMGLVSQEPILFAQSIRENVRFGQPSATDAQVEDACKAANAHGFIANFPQGYDTFVGAAGSQLSGGQKQRIAIALLREPKVLLLDEATAALDNESERLVNEAIERLLTSDRQRTTIVIAHRLSSIQACDKIIVMERGVVVEEGTHTELSANAAGHYAALIKLSNGKQIGTEATTPAPDAEDPHDASPDKPASVADDPVLLHSTSMLPLNSIATAPLLKDDDQAEAAAATTKKKRPRVSFRRALPFVRDDKLLFIPAVLGATLNGMMFPLMALLMSNLMSIFFGTNVSWILSQAATFSLAFFGLGIAAGLCNLMQHTSFGIVNGRTTARVRSTLFRHLVALEIGFFDLKENSIGSLTSKLASDAAMVKAAISDRLEVAVQNVATLVTGLTIAFVATWKVSLVVFAIFPLVAAAGMVQMLVMGGLANSDQDDLAEAAHTLSEAISGIRTVTAFSMGPLISKLYYEQLSGPLQRGTRKGFVGGAAFGLSNSIMFFAYALCYWYGSTLIANGEISFLNLNQALFGILMSAFALGQAAALAPDIAKGQAALDSVFETLDRPSAIDPFSRLGEKPSQVVGEVRFNQTTFAYPSRKDIVVMKNLELTIAAGSTVAFVGTSGSGKSTAVMLMERFYDVDEGSVTLDGKDVRQLNVEWLRGQIGLVQQEPALLDATVLENIRMGRLSATDEECIEAARQSNAYNFIASMPDGFNTNCGAKGSQLSGGQKQRIAIARALVRKPAILLLDEATSALDEESQRIVQDALDKLLATQRRTTFIVAHRLSTIRNATMICVLSAGVVIEMGTYEELVAKGGAFASLLKSQQARDDGGH